MFKENLQEVCHQRNWGPPSYSYVRDGPGDSSPFRASVFVNEVPYDSPTVSKSSKKALNKAAKLAFSRLTAGVEPIAEVPETDKSIKSSHSNLSPSDVKVGKLHHQHKQQLQQFAHRKNLDPPLYTCKKEGPSHALQFQAKVTIGGQSYETQGYYRNLKDAEHAAAKVALLSLDVLEEIDTLCYKNFLQDLTQKRRLILPGYKTLTYGPPHQPLFFSTVEIEGEIFHGEGGKSKKLSELSAAKAAYLLLMKREFTGDLELISSGSSSEAPQYLGPLTDINSKKSLVGSSPGEGSLEFAIRSKDEKDDFSPNSLVNTKASSVCSSPKEGHSFAVTVAPPDLSFLTITPKTEKKVDMGNYLLCNKVRVYTSIPTTELPEGTVLLPIDNNKWVAVSLEFPIQTAH